MNRASLACLSGVILVVACKKPSTQTGVAESVRAAELALERSGPAPETAVFLAESGVVSFAWSVDSPAGAQKGEGVMKFDRWGRRQATSGYPGPNPDKIVLWEGGELKTYIKALRSVVSMPIPAMATSYKPEERRTLQQDFSGRTTRIVAGTRCFEVATEIPQPNGTAGHTDCIGRGIVLETNEHISGGMFGDFKVHMVATKVAWNESIPESTFEIPKDVPVSPMAGAATDSP
jgi:hypothetical protein